MSHQPQLRYRITRCHVRADVAQNVLVTEQHRAVKQNPIQNLSKYKTVNQSSFEREKKR